MIPSKRACAVLLILLLAALSACGETEVETQAASRPPVEILIDAMGVPHVYGATDDLAFYGAGYQMATDRLYQMESLRRFSLGRLSEVIGKDGLERDMQARTFDFPRWGRLDYELMKTEDPERVRLVSAWLRGINRRIEEIRTGQAPLPFGYGPDELDFLPEPWDEADPYIILKGANFALDKTVEFEVAVSILSLLYPQAMATVEIPRPAHAVYTVPPEDRPVAPRGEQANPLPEKRFMAESPVRAGCAPAHGALLCRKDRTGAGLRADALASLPGHRALAIASGSALRTSRLASWPRPVGSNNFAVDGRFTETGRPLIAGDPHLGFDFFGAPYPLHINSADAGGTYDVIGFAYPGTPGIALGHNRRVMWAVTSAFPDVNDVWNARRTSTQLLAGDQWVKIAKRHEEIMIRKPGGPVGQGRVKKMVYEDVEGYGVIIPMEVVGIPIGGPYLMNWTGFKPRPARWFMELNRVDSVDAFERAVDRMREMTYNFLAADAAGISYRVGVEVPLRQETGGDRAPWKAMRSWDPGSLWTGQTLASSQLPRSRAEERGWLATANNDPFGFTGDGRVDNDPWYYGALFDPGYRAQRIADELERLTARGRLTIQDFQGLQTDLHSTLADDLLPLLAEAYSRIGSDDNLAPFRDQPRLDSLVKLLTVDWDRRMARDSGGALAFQAFLRLLVARALKDDIPLAYDFAMNLQAIFVIKVGALLVSGAYPGGEEFLQGGRDVVLLSAALETADWLFKSFGSVDPPAYTYADRKRTGFADAFGYGMPVFSKPTDGGEDTVNVSQNISFSKSAPEWVSSYVPVERSVGTFGEDGTPEAFVNFPLGAHADPASADTLAANQDYIEGRYRKLLFERAEIEAALRERIVLAPE